VTVVAVLVVLVVHVPQRAGHSESKFTSSPPTSAATLQSGAENDKQTSGSDAPLQFAVEVVTVAVVMVAVTVVAVALVTVVTVAVVVDVGQEPHMTGHASCVPDPNVGSLQKFSPKSPHTLGSTRPLQFSAVSVVLVTEVVLVVHDPQSTGHDAAMSIPNVNAGGSRHSCSRSSVQTSGSNLPLQFGRV